MAHDLLFCGNQHATTINKPPKETAMKSKQAGHKNWMSAITFAEAGEWATAREMMPDGMVNKKISWFSSIFMAVAFAENDMRDDALS